VYILGLSGKKQSGKDTFGKQIQKIWRSDKLGLNGNHLAPLIMDDCCLFAFADELKQAAAKYFRIDIELMYGTDKDKNSLTHIKWTAFPIKIVRKQTADEYMTVRQVLQFWGSNIMRAIYGNVWVDCTMDNINKYSAAVSVLTDVRFPNEVEAIKKAGGRVIRLTRNPLDDQHESETALDDYSSFDVIFDNSNLTVEQQNHKCKDIMKQLGIL